VEVLKSVAWWVHSKAPSALLLLSRGALHCRTMQDAAAISSDDEDDFVYNPLKLPMGWDGKPIPYWLYKLHGLNQVPHQTLPA